MSGTTARGAPRWAWAVLVAVLLFDVWWRGHTFGPSVRDRLGVAPWPVVAGEAEPLDCDEAAYAYIGRRIARGDVMYRDLTENKPPGGYWLYALAVAAGGATEWTVRLLPIPLALGTIALVWWIALRLSGPAAAVVAAALYALLSTDPYLYGNGAQLEQAINLGATAALALMIGAWGRADRRLLVAAGAALGAACLVKQVAALHGLVFGAALLLRRAPDGGARAFRARALDLAALVAGLGLSCGLALAVLAARGAAAAAFDDIVRYGGALATDTPADPRERTFLVRWITGNIAPNGALPWPFGAARIEERAWWAAGSWPLWLASVPALSWLWLGRRAIGPRRLLVAWTLSAWVQVALPGLFWQHYYLLPTPGIAVAVAVLLADSGRVARAPHRSLPARAGAGMVAGLVAIAALGTGWIQVRDYLLVPPEALTARYKGGTQWIVLRQLGRDLGRRARVWDDPRLFLWGWQSPLYLYAGLDGASRQVFTDDLLRAHAATAHPLIRPRVDRIMAELHARPPELVFAGYPPFPALAEFLRTRYLPSHLVPTAPDGRGLWVERTRHRQFEAAGSP